MVDPLRPLVLIARAEDEGSRLDRFIRERSGRFSRLRARAILSAGGVWVNGQRVKIASRALHPGDRVEVFPLPDLRRSSAPAGVNPFRVVYEDGAVMVVDKASGVLVQPTPQGDRGTLLDLIRRYLRRRHPEARNPYLGLLHRIDRETSGLLLFSRRGSANRVLSEQFRSHALAREYLAVVRGEMKDDARTLTSRLRRPAPGARRTARGGERPGKTAVTHYRVVERFGAATVLAVTLRTGRTHQIRIHLADQGHPVVGDRVYGSPGGFPRHPVLDRFPRQALHAARLGFTHPFNGRWLEFEAPLPADLAELLASLRGGPPAHPATGGSG